MKAGKVMKIALPASSFECRRAGIATLEQAGGNR
jgi:hypothetical protein